jgi:hypothetical protein
LDICTIQYKKSIPDNVEALTGYTNDTGTSDIRLSGSAVRRNNEYTKVLQYIDRPPRA